jgi:hypothetical protein
MSCEKDDPTVIDPALNFPSIRSQTLNPAAFNSDSVKSTATVHVSSIDPIGKVSVTVTDPNNLSREFDLHDDGVAPDVTANDGIYSGYIDFVMTCRIVGTYKAEFLAITQAGLASNTISQNFNVTNTSSQSPVVSGFFVTPHDVVSGQGGTFIIFWTRVSDPDGACDISNVQITGFKPDNSAITPFNLLDDGNLPASGDSTANDGHFTRATFGDPPQNGYFRYFVRAYDRSGDSSNVLADSIFVHH